MKQTFRDALEEIKRERQRVWLTEPDEIEKARKLKGTYGSRYMHLEYARGDLHGCADALSSLRESLKDEDVNLTGLKAITRVILEFYARRMIEWYKLHTVERVLRSARAAVDGIETKDEYKQLMEELLLFIGKLSWWYDIATPWVELNQLYEILVPE